MKIIISVERYQKDGNEEILRHRNHCKEEPPGPPPPEIMPMANEPKLDYGFFEQTCL